MEKILNDLTLQCFVNDIPYRQQPAPRYEPGEDVFVFIPCNSTTPLLERQESTNLFVFDGWTPFMLGGEV